MRVEALHPTGLVHFGEAIQYDLYALDGFAHYWLQFRHHLSHGVPHGNRLVKSTDIPLECLGRVQTGAWRIRSEGWYWGSDLEEFGSWCRGEPWIELDSHLICRF